MQDRIKNHGLENICTFIEGDIRNTLDSFLNKSNLKKSSDSFYCKLLYIDTSSYTPSKIAMEKLYDHIVPGGIISIDQRTQGGETNAIIDFCKDRSLEVKTGKFFNDVPAYIVKIIYMTKLIVELSINHSGHLNNKMKKPLIILEVANNHMGDLNHFRNIIKLTTTLP